MRYPVRIEKLSDYEYMARTLGDLDFYAVGPSRDDALHTLLHEIRRWIAFHTGFTVMQPQVQLVVIRK